MQDQNARTARRQRADAVANRARVIDAATAVFKISGNQASLEAVARQAGVGIGTLYRHFSSREVLAAAVYRHEVDELVVMADELMAEPDAVLALRKWLHATVDFVAIKKGMSAALALEARMPAELTAYSSNHLTDAVGRLLSRATERSRSHPAIGPRDVLQMLVALCYELDTPEWESKVGVLLDVFVDGLTVDNCRN